MKVCVLNSSGNVGKSTITRLLLNDRLNNPLIVEVESYNSSSAEFKSINSKKFAGNENFETFYEFLISEDDIIFDVGASEIASFFDNSTEYAGAISEFDYFIIPTKADSKIMEDTAKTINFLRTQEIEDEKIKVIFNEVETTVVNEFAPLLNYKFVFDTELFIKKSNLIKDLSLLKETFLSVYKADKQEYRVLLKSETDAKEKRKFLKLDLLNRAADKKIAEFDFLFSKAFGTVYSTNLTTTKKEVKKKVEKKETTKIVENKNTEDGIDENDEDI